LQPKISKMTKYFVLGMLLASAAVSAQKGKAKKAAPAGLLKTKLDTLSYALAINTANQLKGVAVDSLNYAVFSKGLQDALGKKNLLLNDQQISMSINEKLQAYMAKKTMATKTEGARFMAENKKRPGVIETQSGLQYEMVIAGDATSASPTVQDTVVVHYKGSLLNGQVFDESYQRGQPVTFQLTRVIAGWTEVLQLMKKGSKVKCYIPADLAYGDGGYGGQIPGGATLLFDIELLDIKTAAKK
jgi:FKBP-type peptidyl-prolyl cis-trans isomerase